MSARSGDLSGAGARLFCTRLPPVVVSRYLSTPRRASGCKKGRAEVVTRGRAASMELFQVRYFLALTKTLNFTRAAETCHVSQPALTRAIQRLEEELGGPLLYRERSQTQLTALGRAMAPHLEAAYA